MTDAVTTISFQHKPGDGKLSGVFAYRFEVDAKALGDLCN